MICEYNPFHRGHLTQFRQIRTLFGEDAAIVCLMSGNFVQRGACAVFDKLVRASAAVDCGANLVLELPVTGALRSAEGFARCGVEILDALGVETLAFGSESGETEDFLRLAAAMDTPEYDAALRAALDTPFDLLVLDEACAACRHQLVDEALLRQAAAMAKQGREVVLTGRDPAPWMQEAADYSTELRAVRHPYTQGIPAREGIEY